MSTVTSASSRRPFRLHRTLAAAVLLVAALSGCSAEGSSQATNAPSAPAVTQAASTTSLEEAIEAALADHADAEAAIEAMLGLGNAWHTGPVEDQMSANWSELRGMEIDIVEGFVDGTATDRETELAVKMYAMAVHKSAVIHGVLDYL
ncbi:hypothetical protein [Arthrobacter sp. IK3]|uniref:hypothetical protein n=1 Tax=Arthrobacter sp. IK3 TaxID=3448169 RepID=UPI003EDEFA26